MNMKMTKQTRIFAKQVQVDLLALTNADLFQMIHLWLHTGLSDDVSQETRSALGYTLKREEAYTHSLSTASGSAVEVGEQWLAPAPQQLRERLMEMDTKLFIQYVLPIAFQALHATHTEWGEGATFNAHLANHLRAIGGKR